MSDIVAEEYLQLLAGDKKAQLALLACSAAFRLNDEMAEEVIELIAESNGTTKRLRRRVKSLGCVWKLGEESWCIAEDVRPYLANRLYDRLKGSATLLSLHARLTTQADEMAARQISAHRAYQAKFEAAIYRLMLPDQAGDGATQLADLWQQTYPGPVSEATADSVEHLIPEIKQHHQSLPAEVLFMRGMAARARRNRRAQEEYFGKVYKQGRQGRIYALAAFFYALIVRNRHVAEQALWKCIEWDHSIKNQVIAYHELGNLLSKLRPRRKDAEAAYLKSLEIDPDLRSQAQTWHSLGDLLTEQGRWAEAKEAYETSLRLRLDKPHQGQVYHSLGNLLSEQPAYWKQAEEAYQKSIDLLEKQADKGQVYHSRGKLLAKQSSRWLDAEKDFRQSIALRDNPVYKAYVFHSLGNLLSNQPLRWREAENAYKRSLELRDDPADKIHVLASWARLLSKFAGDDDYRLAETFARDNIAAAKNDATRAIYYKFLADIYEHQGKLDEAIEALEALLSIKQHTNINISSDVLGSRLTALRQRRQQLE